MKHLNFLSNLLSLSLGSPCTDVSLDRRLTVGSPSGRYCSGLIRLVFILTILLTVGSGNVWGAEGDRHNFSQSFSQLLNNNASISSINIAEQSYPVKEVIISFRYNKTIENAVTMTVSVGGDSWGSKYCRGTGSNYTDTSYTHSAASGAIVISFTNNTGSGTGHGTFYVNNICLVEGASASTPHTITFNAGTGTCGTASSGSVTSYTLPAASPSASCALEGWVFAGWKESSTQSSASAPASKLWQAGETYSPAADITLYAVYFKASGNTYEYIDNLNSLFDGAKMIITAYNSGDYAVSNTTDGDGYIYSSSVSPDGDEVISSPANSIVWTLKGYKDNWTLKNVGNNKYIIVSTRPALADVSETFSITYEVDEDDYDQFNIQKGSKYLYMWNDNTFSGYNKTYLYFYQQQGTYITNPSCCTPLGSINGSFF